MTFERLNVVLTMKVEQKLNQKSEYPRITWYIQKMIKMILKLNTASQGNHDRGYA